MRNFILLRIKSFELIKYNIIKINLSDDSVYTADISSFQSVYCYPKNEAEWLQAFVGEFKTAIEWPCGFDIHLDQIANIAIKQSA
ncbi:MAG: hypothetical protein HOP07_00785 [Bacteriovoracaceae bacterium]|nr:hypothetical protein [Bacteriovoracaceae bacterium]